MLGIHIKVTGDSLHQEIFVSNKPLICISTREAAMKLKQNKNIANMLIETAVSTFKRLSHRESQAMIRLWPPFVTNFCVKFYLDKGF